MKPGETGAGRGNSVQLRKDGAEVVRKGTAKAEETGGREPGSRGLQDMEVMQVVGSI